ncbi:MAG: hypothetical protein M3O25_00765 [Actinomycetota bacterium]|nr:hypothetical protein [Actinomycetota bacterium]
MTSNEKANAMVTSEITIRTLGGADRPALVRLSERDSKRVPAGRLLGAFVGGALVAAVPLAGGAVVADPFIQTADARSLLQRRWQQLRRSEGSGGGRLKRLFGRRSRAALPVSPPGGGGRLLTLAPPPACR